jgi:short-subunit dehydrogenase
MSKGPTVIAITGASSGIGAALAQHYAAPGRTLALIGRHEERLNQVAQDCRDKGAATEIGMADVRDRRAIAEWLLAFDARAPIDLLVANAGILTGSLQDGTIESLDMSTAQIETNFLGALNTALPVLEPMLARGKGQIAFTSSLAAFASHPDWPAYCASKAGLLVYAMSLRERVRGSGVRINTICPGWVTAPINDPFVMWRPMEMRPEAAAKAIARGLARDRAVIAFPQPLAFSSRHLMPLLPRGLHRLGYKLFKARHRPQTG